MSPDLPKTYKAATFREANGPLTLINVDLKLPEEGQVLLKILATGVCHADQLVR